MQYQCKQFQAKPQLLETHVLLRFHLTVIRKRERSVEKGEKWKSDAARLAAGTLSGRGLSWWGTASSGVQPLGANWPILGPDWGHFDLGRASREQCGQGVQHVLPRHSCCHPLHPLQDPQCEQQCREVDILLQKPKVPWGVFEASTRVRASICANKVLGFLGPHPNHHPGIHTFSTLLFYMIYFPQKCNQQTLLILYM